jgi:DNA-binding transcriptional regulator LsrR (DeoR family)
MANSFNESIIKSIMEQNAAGDMWIYYYIDDEGALRMNITNELTT